EGPAPRTTTTRTPGGSAPPMAARACHIAGVIALRRSALSRVIVAAPGAGAPTSSRSPARPRSGSPTVMLSSALRPGLAPGGAATAAQRDPVLRQDAVHESVGPAGRRGE